MTDPLSNGCAQVLAEVGSPLRLVQLGCGRQGARHLQQMVDCPAVEVVGVSDRDPAALMQHRPPGVAGDTDAVRLLARTGPEAGVLAVPHSAYPDLLRACGDAGLSVLKEKPLAVSGPQARSLRRLCDPDRLVVGVQRRQSQAYQHLVAELARSTVTACTYRYVLGIASDGGPDASWRGDAGLAGGGAMLDMGYHAVDLVVGLLGVPDRVYAVLHPRQRSRGGSAVEQRGTVLLEFQEDCVATLLVGRHLVPKAERFSLSTEDCTYEYDEGLGLRRAARELSTQVAVAEKPEELRHKQLHEFVRHARGLPSLAVTFDDSMPTMVTLDACYASARTRAPVAPRWPARDDPPRTGSRPPDPGGDADAPSPR